MELSCADVKLSPHKIYLCQTTQLLLQMSSCNGSVWSNVELSSTTTSSPATDGGSAFSDPMHIVGVAIGALIVFCFIFTLWCGDPCANGQLCQDVCSCAKHNDSTMIGLQKENRYVPLFSRLMCFWKECGTEKGGWEDTYNRTKLLGEAPAGVFNAISGSDGFKIPELWRQCCCCDDSPSTTKRSGGMRLWVLQECTRLNRSLSRRVGLMTMLLKSAVLMDVGINATVALRSYVMVVSVSLAGNLMIEPLRNKSLFNPMPMRLTMLHHSSNVRNVDHTMMLHLDATICRRPDRPSRAVA